MIIWKKKLIECCKCHKRYSFDDNLFYHFKEYILICPNCNLMHKVNIQLLGKEYEGLKKIDKLNLTAINIGSEAINRTGTRTAGNTAVDKNLPANATGTITSVQIYAAAKMSNVEVGIFYIVSGNNLSTRSNVTLGTVEAGYSESPVNLPVEVNDLIGLYWTAGELDYDTATGNGFFQKAGDNIPCTNTTFTSYSNRK